MPKISIYSAPTCTYCQLAKQFFDDNKVEYTEINVAEDEVKRNELIEKTGRTAVPVIVLTKEDGNEEVIVGFDEVRLRDSLGL